MKIESYENLIVWQKAINLVEAIYALVGKFPKEEQFGLTSQMKRAALSIPSNIAEGSRRGSKKDFRHFLLNAYGSGAELETQIKIAQRLSFMVAREAEVPSDLLREIMKMLNVLIRNLQ